MMEGSSGSPLTGAPSGSKKSLKTSVSLNLQKHISEGLGFSGDRPISPLNYEFLLRRPSTVIEEQMEVGARQS